MAGIGLEPAAGCAAPAAVHGGNGIGLPTAAIPEIVMLFVIIVAVIARPLEMCIRDRVMCSTVSALARSASPAAMASKMARCSCVAARARAVSAMELRR